MLPAFVSLGQRRPLLRGDQRLADRLPALEHVRRARAPCRGPRPRARAGQGDRLALGRRWPSPRVLALALAVSPSRCWASSTATTSATPPSSLLPAPAGRGAVRRLVDPQRRHLRRGPPVHGHGHAAAGHGRDHRRPRRLPAAAAASPPRPWSPPPPTRPIFVASLIAYKRVSAVPWRSFVPTPRRVRALPALGAQRQRRAFADFRQPWYRAATPESARSSGRGEKDPPLEPCRPGVPERTAEAGAARSYSSGPGVPEDAGRSRACAAEFAIAL